MLYMLFTFLFFNDLNFVTLIITKLYNNLYIIFYFKDIFCELILFLLSVLFWWQNFMTIVIMIVIRAEYGDDLLFFESESKQAYIKFFKNIWYNFFYSLMKFYIMLDKKNKNYFFIFFRWVLFITPIYWLFLLFCFYTYYCYSNLKILINLMIPNFILFKLSFSFLESIYQIFYPILNLIYYYLFNKFNFNKSFLKFIKKIYKFLIIIFKKILFYLQVYKRRIKKFFKYKIKFYIYFKLLKKSFWIKRYNKFKFFLNWVFKRLRLINKKFSFSIYFNYFNFKLLVFSFIKWILNFPDYKAIEAIVKKKIVLFKKYLIIQFNNDKVIIKKKVIWIKSKLKMIWRDKIVIIFNIVLFCIIFIPITLQLVSVSTLVKIFGENSIYLSILIKIFGENSIYSIYTILKKWV